MNGDVLPIERGFPVRMLVPGWVGITNIKWVGSIQVSQSPLYSLYHTEKYILIGDDYPVPPNLQKAGVLGETATKQKPKSAFELLWAGEIKADKHLVRGRSWSSQGKIDHVAVSLDGGKTWQPARLRELNLARRTWVRWDVDWNPRPGRYQ